MFTTCLTPLEHVSFTVGFLFFFSLIHPALTSVTSMLVSTQTFVDRMPTISSSLFNYQLQRASEITLQIGRQSAKQNPGEIIEMSDSSARVEQMDQTDKWSLDPSAVSPELQQQKTPLNKFQHGSLKAAPGTISLFLLFCQLAMYFWSSYFNAWGFPKSIQ